MRWDSEPRSVLDAAIRLAADYGPQNRLWNRTLLGQPRPPVRQRRSTINFSSSKSLTSTERAVHPPTVHEDLGCRLKRLPVRTGLGCHGGFLHSFRLSKYNKAALRGAAGEGAGNGGIAGLRRFLSGAGRNAEIGAWRAGRPVDSGRDSLPAVSPPNAVACLQHAATE